MPAVETLDRAPREIREAKAQYEKYQKAVRQLEKHVSRGNGGKFELKVKTAKEAGLDPEIFDELKRSLEMANEHGRQGIIRAEEVAESTPEPGDLTGRQESGPGLGEVGPTHSSPSNHTHNYWWGTQIFANDSFTHDMIAGAQKSTAAITAILVAIGVGAPIAAAIAAAVFLIAGLLWGICAWGGHKGLVVSMTWAGTVTVWHQ